jgi:hypothetical protein
MDNPYPPWNAVKISLQPGMTKDCLEWRETKPHPSSTHAYLEVTLTPEQALEIARLLIGEAKDGGRAERESLRSALTEARQAVENAKPAALRERILAVLDGTDGEDE